MLINFSFVANWGNALVFDMIYGKIFKQQKNKACIFSSYFETPSRKSSKSSKNLEKVIWVILELKNALKWLKWYS